MESHNHKDLIGNIPIIDPLIDLEFHNNFSVTIILLFSWFLRINYCEFVFYFFLLRAQLYAYWY